MADAAPHRDASFDAGPEAPDGGVATIAVIREGDPVLDVDVVFHDEEGRVLAVERTDRDGRTTHTVPSRGMVTTIRPNPDGSGTVLQTIAGVSPGDFLLFGTEADPDARTFGRLEVSLPGTFSGAVRYEVETGCGSASSPSAPATLAIDVPISCLGPSGTVNVLATAVDMNGAELAFATARDVFLSSAGTATRVTLPSWRTDFEDPLLRLSNAPRASAMIVANLSMTRDEVEFRLGERQASVAPGTGATFAFAGPRDFAFGLTFQIALLYDASSPDSASTLLERRSSFTNRIDVDLAGAMLPRVFGGMIDTAIPRRPIVTWGADPGEPPDAIVILLAWDQGRSSWATLLPPDSPARFSFPEVPESRFSTPPPGQSSAFEKPGVIELELDTIPDYGAFKRDLALRVFNGGPPRGSKIRFSAFNFR